ncbi:C-type lectin domain family 4 member E-like [Alosa sapidissima]|uniref:C-type lectin domain family 4 member E-like n=1 Tax=Alosa sapidissima TaxID=34773 RepID=UPI001C09ED2B|nr:C-type lectin domain family 4 member E-like [Alosa sapidissima]
MELLESSFNKLKHEKGQILISHNNLTKENDRLWKIVSKLERDCCPENWWKHSSSCYFISAVEKTWNESRQYCREKDGDLVIINSKEEQEFLNDNMKEGMKEIWIGLSDTDTEGVWRWVDGTPLTGSCRMWRMGEPNDSDGNEDCAVFCRITQSSPQHSSIRRGHPATLQVWNDVPCFRPMPFICERKQL